MRAPWRIEMFGALRAIQGDQTVTQFRTRRVASLLAYLASFKNQAHSRDLLADLLWPDKDFEVSRRNLRQAVYELRKVLEPQPHLTGRVLLTVNDGFQLDPDAITTDVEEFEGWISASKRGTQADCLQRAVKLYKGPLLPGFADSWIVLEQLRLEDLYLFALAELGDANEAAAAVGSLRTGLKLDPGNQKWHIGLIERYLEVGQPKRAKAQFSELMLAIDGESSGVLDDLADRIESALRPDSPSNQPKQVPIASPRLNLPAVANRFFGREQEIDRILDIFSRGSSRLITLLGPAGVGKTRLGIESGRLIASRLAWDVVFVPLDDRTNGNEIFEAIISAIQPNQTLSDQPVFQIVTLTKSRPTVLILDNLEQIVAQASPHVAELLAAGPDLRCLGTSREPLMIAEEQIVSIAPLPLPLENWRTAEQLESVPSVQMFLDRCQAIRPEIRLDRRSAKVIADLCARFDGLPLAIEIAAGFSGSFSFSQMLRHLPDRQTEVLNRRRDSPARHKSLRAAIDWGFQSLAPELAQLFLKLSVFRGSFGLEAAKDICFEGDGSIINAIHTLVERSLLRRHGSDEDLAPRFSLLVAFREYAEHKISAAEMEKLRSRHAKYFVGRAPPARPFWGVEEQTAVHMEIEGDYQNFLAAVEYSISIGDFSLATDLLEVLSVRWLTQGPKVAERDLIRRLSLRPEVEELEPAKRVLLLRMMGTTCIRSGEYLAAYDCCAKAVTIAQRAGDAELEATCYSGLSVCAGYLDRLEECAGLNLKVLELVGDNNLVLAERSHLGLGSVYANWGQFEKAEAEFELARKLSERLRGGEPDALIVVNQADAFLELGQVEQAIRFAHEAIRISKRLKDEFTLALALTALAKSHLKRGEAETAAATNLEALTRFGQGSFVFWTLRSLRNHAIILSHLERFTEAVTLLSMTAEIARGPESHDFTTEEIAVQAARSAMQPNEFEAAWAKGLGMGPDEAFDLLSIG